MKAEVNRIAFPPLDKGERLSKDFFLSSKPLSGNQRISADSTSSSELLHLQPHPRRMNVLQPHQPQKWLLNHEAAITSRSVAILLSALCCALALGKVEFTEGIAHRVPRYSVNYNSPFSTILNNQDLGTTAYLKRWQQFSERKQVRI